MLGAHFYLTKLANYLSILQSCRVVVSLPCPAEEQWRSIASYFMTLFPGHILVIVHTCTSGRNSAKNITWNGESHGIGKSPVSYMKWYMRWSRTILCMQWQWWLVHKRYGSTHNCTCTYNAHIHVAMYITYSGCELISSVLQDRHYLERREQLCRAFISTKHIVESIQCPSSHPLTWRTRHTIT